MYFRQIVLIFPMMIFVKVKIEIVGTWLTTILVLTIESEANVLDCNPSCTGPMTAEIKVSIFEC